MMIKAPRLYEHVVFLSIEKKNPKICNKDSDRVMSCFMTGSEWLPLWSPSHHSSPCNHSPCQCGHLVRGLHRLINTTLHWYTPSLYQTTLQHQITSNYITHHYIPAHYNTPQFCTLHCITLHTICLFNTSLIHTTLLTRADLGVLSTQQSESGH